MARFAPHAANEPAGSSGPRGLPGASGADEAGGSCTLAVGDMDCSSCAESVSRALRSVHGVRAVEADVLAGKVTVSYDPDHVAEPQLADAVRRAGYAVTNEAPSPSLAVEERRAGLTLPAWRDQTRLLYVLAAGICWAGSLLAAYVFRFPTTAAVLAIGAIVFGGRYIVPRGLLAARNRSLDMNFLMTIAAVGALFIGEYGEAASAMFLFAVAQLLESRSMDRARNAIRGLMDLSPATASVLVDGVERRVPADAVHVGQLVVVRPGEKIPVDGAVVTGSSSVNQAPITGEAVPVDKDPGDDVFAGTLNGDGVLEVRSTRPAEDTTLARIIHSVEEAQAHRAPSQTFVDRFARVYTPAVVVAAVLLAVLPPLLGYGAFEAWFYRALVLLVVACPCALVISTPVTIVSALAGGARRGILIKGGLHLENTGRARVVVLDKTGTLTEGEPSVLEVVALGGDDADRVLELAAAAEARSEHPLGRAIVRHAREAGLDRLHGHGATAMPGRGMRATVQGERIYVGSERLFREMGVMGPAVEEVLRGYETHGRTAVLVGRVTGDGDDARPVPIGLVALEDRLRPAAAEALRALHEAGIARVVMLTGDNPGTARSVVEALNAGGRGVDEYRAGLLPQDKVEAVRALREELGGVIFVGDGVNDAPALASADVGVAMGAGGTDVALETADVALMSDDLAQLPVAVRLARKAEGIIRFNIALSLVTKAAFVALAVSGHATLWMAVAADMGTSLLVTFNGMRALRP
jgi:Zn2+/Cd2+-exporting ATPase